MKPRQATGPSVIPVPRMLGAFALGCVVAVLAIPALGRLLGQADGGPSLLVLILTWAAVTAASGAYLFPMSVVLGFPRDWFRFGLGCLAALELILFVLIPRSLVSVNVGGVERFVVALASLILALLVFGQIAKAARRYLPPGEWPVQAKAIMASIAAVAGLLGRLATAQVLGDDPMASALSAEGLLTIVAAALSGLSLAHGMDRATRPAHGGRRRAGSGGQDHQDRRSSSPHPPPGLACLPGQDFLGGTKLIVK